jgi:hypothetical protein
MVYVLLFLIIYFISFAIIINQYFEHFVTEKFITEYNGIIIDTNKDNNIFNRHPIQHSIQNDKKIKYKNAYYYEYDNETYYKKLIQTFKNQNCYINQFSFHEWHTESSIYITSIYQKIYDFLYNKINQSKYLSLEDSSNIQIVHDKLNRYSIQNDIVILDLDLILYREFKNHGKHINLYISMNKNNQFNVFFINILGTVHEDKIHSSIVKHHDKFDISYATL